MLTIKIFNSMSRKKETFKPKGKTIAMYVCGPTVYDLSHVGHARTYVTFDVVRRYLEHKGYKVKYAVNITDVEDKIIRRSAELGMKPDELAKEIEITFHEDMEKLGIKKATYNPRVTDTMREIIAIIQKLVAKGFAYQVDGDVYFDISKFKQYGKLSGNKEEALQFGARVEPDPRKRNPADFALWKAAKPGEPYWDSPWSFGRPGWHIECSAMAGKLFGGTLDIHGGGSDLKFPHHENEIAQSEAASGKALARIWMHTGMVQVDGQKMAKSLKNFITIRDALKKVSAQSLRLLLLRTHYRSPVDFSDENMEQAAVTQENVQDFYQKIVDFARRVSSKKKSSETAKLVKDSRSKFEKSMENDFNTAETLATFFDFVHKINKVIDERVLSRTDFEAILEFINEVNKIFGIIGPVMINVPEGILLKIKEREDLRKKKKFADADKVRNELRILGWNIEDTLYGPRPKRIISKS